MKTLLRLLTLFVFVAINATAVISQEKESAKNELKAEVPELTQYHKVIYKLWHDLWPKKNVNGIAGIFNDVEDGAMRIKNAKLPGILRDKEKVWNENVEKLIQIVKELKEAIERNDSIAILKKSEELHSQYEKLVRIIKPVIKEIDEFHQVLYMLYHYYVPEYNIQKIKEGAVELKEKMEKLKEAKLPERFKTKESKFKELVSELDREVFEFVKITGRSFSEKEINQQMEKVHSKYRAIEKLFE